MKVYWTLEARARLLDIQAYIAQYSPKAARLVTTRLLRRSRRLAVPPLEGATPGVSGNRIARSVGTSVPTDLPR
jgi:plasmid stabilization system protein ParE